MKPFQFDEKKLLLNQLPDASKVERLWEDGFYLLGILWACIKDLTTTFY